MKFECNWLNHKNNHNIEVGQRILGFGERDGKMYYKIQKDVSGPVWSQGNCYSGTNPLLRGTYPMIWSTVLRSTSRI